MDWGLTAKSEHGGLNPGVPTIKTLGDFTAPVIQVHMKHKSMWMQYWVLARRNIKLGKYNV